MKKILEEDILHTDRSNIERKIVQLKLELLLLLSIHLMYGCYALKQLFFS